MTDLSGRTALVTGGGSGIGRATAEALAARGAAVAVLDVDRVGAEAAVAAIAGSGGRAVPIVADVRDRAAVDAGVRDTSGHLGAVTILVNNAGVAGNNAALEEIDDAAFDRMFGVHVKGAFHCAQAVISGMKEAGWGRIVNISSNRGQVGFERSCHYSAAKAALLGFTKAWARELAPHGITVNAVAPGVVITPLTLAYGVQAVREEADLNLLKRWAEPTEIAATVAFLVGPDGAYYTGQVLCPNGGDPIVGI